MLRCQHSKCKFNTITEATLFDKTLDGSYVRLVLIAFKPCLGLSQGVLGIFRWNGNTLSLTCALRIFFMQYVLGTVRWNGIILSFTCVLHIYL
mmetsp:Transcript_9890/g.27680  ORF Transcript_9890/g.27680 Transcript_9890/m.27680 type:complete len:93 (+) Transcript_9890:955-1233(+)